jgi:A/G-specific adenine glycosylase
VEAGVLSASSSDDGDDGEPEPAPCEAQASDDSAPPAAARRRSKKRRTASRPLAPGVAAESTVDSFTPAEIASLRKSVLTWYVNNYRRLPWRAPPRYRVDGPCVHPSGPPESQSSPGAPYAVWVSEVMSQQTRLSVVVEYWKRWMAAFPTVEALAAAPLERVNEHWSGLGYYARARYLHQAASQIVSDFGGELPQTVPGLLKVKGIGKYTAGAICSIAFNVPAPAVDGNVERVLSRLRPGITPNKEPSSSPGAKAKVFEALATEVVADVECCGDVNQALMELGATVCTPKSPRCGTCPVQGLCGAYAEAAAAGGNTSEYAERYPVKDLSRKTKSRDEVVLVCAVRRVREVRDGRAAVEYLLLRRPETGLLAGLWESPNIVLASEDASKHASAAARSRLMSAYLGKLLPQLGCSSAVSDGSTRKSAGEATHVFSHIRQQLLVECLEVPASASDAGTADGAAFRWLPESEINDSAVATQMRKALRLAFRLDRAAAGRGVGGGSARAPRAGVKRARARKVRGSAAAAEDSS